LGFRGEILNVNVKSSSVFLHNSFPVIKLKGKNEFICLFAARCSLFTKANIAGKDEEKMKIGKKVVE